MSKKLPPMKRQIIALDPAVMSKLKEYKNRTHHFINKNKHSFSWNEFFTLIISDWEMGRFKCNCGMVCDCEACNVEYTLQKIKLMEKWGQ